MPISQFFSQLANLFKNLSYGKRMTLIILLAGTIGGFFFLMTWSGRIEYQPLYTGLDAEDAGIILSKLKEKKIPYRISSNGSAILIPQESVYETRIDLASQGLPQGGVIGFEVFDHSKLGMSEFSQNVNYQRALQGELARTINGFSEVENCRVHIVMPEKSLFIEDEQPASASVVLKLHAGKWLSKNQVNGIVHLVASSVARLSPENVTVVDSNGKLLAGLKAHDEPGGLSSDQLEYQAKVEHSFEGRIRKMLEKAFGTEKAVVSVSCSLNFTRQENTEEHYYPDNKVVRSEQSAKEANSGREPIPQGVPGIRSNMPPGNTNAVKGFDNRSISSTKQNRTVNYEIGKLTRHTFEPVGEMQRVSVAVMIDGRYQRVKDANGGFHWKYIPRSAEEIEKIKSVCKGAVNFDAARGDKIEVVNIPFETSRLEQADQPPLKKSWLDQVKKYAPYFRDIFLGLFLILTFLFIVKPLIRWLTEHTGPDGEILKQLPKTVGEIESEYARGGRGLTYTDQASRLIESESEASVGAMRTWLKEK